MLLKALLRRLIKTGSLTYYDPAGHRHDFGDPASGPCVAIRITDKRTPLRIALDPRMALGEAYMDGTLRMEQGTLYDFLELCARNLGTQGSMASEILARWRDWVLRKWQQWNPLGASSSNVRHHYDLDGRLYDLFLDTDKQYSCAYFETPETTLEQAQLAKKRHIAAKLRLSPGLRVLDIGSGWGGMALYLAEQHDVEVLGVTLSVEQHAVATKRAQERGLADRVKFEIRDYRKLDGQFDRIVSVGMFEHVGTPHYPAYFNSLKRLLKPDGVALLHSIGRADGPGSTAGFIRRYIFPGGYSPALSEVLPAIERSGMWATDIEILRLHYAETLRHWRQRFMARWEAAKTLYDERFCRMWEFYLAGSEITFRYMGHMVFQIQLAQDVDVLPLTRDYMLEDGRGLALPPAFNTAAFSSGAPAPARAARSPA